MPPLQNAIPPAKTVTLISDIPGSNRVYDAIRDFIKPFFSSTRKGEENEV
jgi:hypothetical protein